MIYVNVILILLFFGMTLWSHLHCLLELEYKVLINNTVILEDSLSFNFIQSITRTWESKAYLISSWIFLFSGLFPYMKLILLLMYSYNPNKNILQFVHKINKFAFLDVYFLILLVSSFYWKADEPVVSNIFIEINPITYYSLIIFICSIIGLQVFTSYLMLINMSNIQFNISVSKRYIKIIILSSCLLLYIWLFDKNIFSLNFIALGVDKEKSLSFYNIYQILLSLPQNKFIAYFYIISIFFPLLVILSRILLLLGFNNILLIFDVGYETVTVLLLSIIITISEIPNLTKYIAMNICETNCLESNGYISYYYYIYVVTMIIILGSITIFSKRIIKDEYHELYV